MHSQNNSKNLKKEKKTCVTERVEWSVHSNAVTEISLYSMNDHWHSVHPVQGSPVERLHTHLYMTSLNGFLVYGFSMACSEF